MDANRAPTPQPAGDSGPSARSPLATDTSAPETPTPTAQEEYGWAPRSHLDYANRDFSKPPLPPSTDPGPPLRYRRTPFWLAVVYLTTLVVPWVLICVLDTQPLTAPSYYYQRSGVSKRALRGTIIFISILRAISGVIVIPITSIILGHAVVTYSQRRDPNQKLNMRQLFALVDRGWADVVTLWNCRGLGSSSQLLWLGALLILLGGIQQPLHSALVFFEPTAVLTCADLPVGGCGEDSNAVTVGFDPDPWAMELLDHRLVVDEVASDLVTVSDSVDQEYLWVDNPHADGPLGKSYDDPTSRASLSWYTHEYGRPNSSFFVTSLANGTETGVLREHAVRLSSEISCKNTTRSEFPSPCPGKRPIYTEINTSGVTLRMCVPGEFGKHPWTRTRNKEDISEDLYLDLHFDERFQMVATENYTMHCTASSTRGYFELGNVMNDQTYGAILDKWPEPETVEDESSDYSIIHPYDFIRPEEIDNGGDSDDRLSDYKKTVDAFGVGKHPPPGPLMTAAVALFGNNSFLQPLADNSSALSPGQTVAVLCEHGGIPFTQVSGGNIRDDLHNTRCTDIPGQLRDEDYEEYAPTQLGEIVVSWLDSFKDAENAKYLLRISTFLANRAVLRQAAAGAGVDARPIYYSPGTLVNKPNKSIASTVIISILILLEVVGLAAMVRYINSVPTWTSSLDTMAVASIARAMGKGEVPPIGPFSEMDRDRLRRVDALVGIVDDDTEKGRRPTQRGSTEGREQDQPRLGRPLMDSDSETEANATGIRFGLGARGLISRYSVPKKPTWIPLRKRKKRTDEEVQQK